MENFRHRVATEADIEFIREVYDENIAALHGTCRSYDTWRELLSDNRYIYYIVYTDAPVAWFRVDWEADELWLGMIQVKPVYHRKGIGTYILSVVEAIAKEKGAEKVGIHTTEDNAAALALYLSAGYHITEIGPCTTADGIDRTGYTVEKQMNR